MLEMENMLPGMENLLKDPFRLLVPVGLLVATLIGGIIIRSILFRIVHGWAKRTDSHLDALVVECLRGPIVLWSLILGIHFATQNSEIPRADIKYIPRTLAVLWIISLTMAMSRLAGNAVRFYGSRVTDGQSVTSLTQKLAQLAVVLLGLVWMLHAFDVNLTPVLTTLGVGGLAVALALQDTLSNLFAGFYVSISGLIHIGDYIKLNTGEEGYITDINWRCTTMRGTSNNLVIVPNNKLGQAIYTNYNLPDTRFAMSLSFSVGYDSDIDRVQAILTEEAVAASHEIEGLLPDPAPSVLFNPGPGEYALGFQVNYSVSEFGRQYKVQSELRKRLYQRLTAENISMPFPTRTVLLEQKNPA
jgi:small-conductance mechanosensitive channel